MSELRSRPSDHIEQEVAAQFPEHFRLLNVMDSETNGVLHRHDGKLKVDGASQTVVGFLFGKSLKSLDAAKFLASKVYGEDSLIILRTVLEVLFSVAYIIAADSEERATNWIADGYLEQVAFIRKFPEEPLPSWVGTLNPAEVQERAARWPTIRKRAENSDLSELYHKRYAFLCSHAHSDTWSSLTYIDPGEGFRIRTEPSLKHVDLALLMVAEFLPPLTECFCRAFGIVAHEHAALRKLGELLNAVIAADARANSQSRS